MVKFEKRRFFVCTKSATAKDFKTSFFLFFFFRFNSVCLWYHLLPAVLHEYLSCKLRMFSMNDGYLNRCTMLFQKKRETIGTVKVFLDTCYKFFQNLIIRGFFLYNSPHNSMMPVEIILLLRGLTRRSARSECCLR